jgi:hypothetical protein
MKKNIDIFCLGLYLALTVSAILSDFSTLYTFASIFAIISYIIAQRTEKLFKPDERELLIHYKATSITLGIVLLLLMGLVFIDDMWNVLDDYPLNELLSLIIGFIFGTTSLLHIIYKRIT